MKSLCLSTHVIALAMAGSLLVVAGTAPSLADADPCKVCEAPIPGESISASTSQTVGFVGLRWNFGSKAPAVTAGIRHTTTDTDNGVLGVKLDLSVDLKPDFTFTPTLRLLGVAGNRDAQAELGLGLDTLTRQGLIAAGIQAPHVNAGANFSFDGTLAPYVELNSLGRPSAPIRIDGELKCSTDGVWMLAVQPDNETRPIPSGGPYYAVDPADIVDGYTCYDPS